jgi:hypothetical protein
MLYNTVTRELYPDGVTVVPVTYNKFYLLWKDRKLGGGFGGQFDTQEEAAAEITEDGWDIVDTPTHLVIMADGNEVTIPMPRSKAKVSRQWNSLIRLAGGPRFSRAYHLVAVEDSSDLGEFWNFAVTPVGYPSEALFKKAEALYEQLQASGYTMAADDSDDGPTPF